MCIELKITDDTPISDARWDLVADKMLALNAKYSKREKGPNRDHFVQMISVSRSLSSSFSMIFASNPLFKDKLMPAMKDEEGKAIDTTSDDFLTPLNNHVDALYEYLTTKASDQQSKDSIKITKSWWDRSVLYDYVLFILEKDQKKTTTATEKAEETRRKFDAEKDATAAALAKRKRELEEEKEEEKRIKKQLGASAAETSLAVSNLSATMGKLVEFLSPDAAGNNGQQDNQRLTAVEKKVDDLGSKLDQILAALKK